MPCPDCEKMVSRRALMCPNCGCKGEVIAEEAARLVKAEEPPPSDYRATIDSRHSTAGATNDNRQPNVECRFNSNNN